MERGFSEFVVERRRARKALKVNQRNLKHARGALKDTDRWLARLIDEKCTDPRMEFVTKELNRLTKAVVELEEAIERCKEITLV